jgi:peptidoglycan/xylan/chitin deacetylase (PgdA/CDA1 family)
MKKSFVFIIFGCLVLFQISAGAQTKERFVAVTIDDLPVVAKNSDLRVRQEITRKLLAHIKKARVPAIGFVNEEKLYRDGKPDEAEIALLQSWLDAGLELGNHTYSHPSLHNISLEKYTEEILKGEIITKELLAKKKMQMRYFRHPFLHSGLDLETKQKLGDFLQTHKYTIAPVTLDNSDWIFARAYDNAIEKKDKNLQKRVGEAYLAYLDTKLDYWERQSVKLFEREIRQMMLLHANTINSDYFDDVAKVFKKRGYKFITLEEALKDEAYKLPDTFTRKAGISWLHRWALAKGKDFVLPNEPSTPEWIMKEAGVDSE